MKVAVVGQGYVGLPLAQAATRVGHTVVGVDLDEIRVSMLNSGHTVIDDLSDADIAEMLELGYRASTSFAEYRDSDVIIICVPTPLSEGKEPDLKAVRAAAAAIAGEVGSGALVVLESTTYPGTTAQEVAPLLRSSGHLLGEEVFLAFSPERIDPGNEVYGITNTPKVVGADDEKSLARATEFYETFVEQVVPVRGTAEAELTKLLENTYRHINIGLVNELAIVCHELEIDVWDVIRAASTKPFGFQAFYPGPGVGGHCIPIDPNYLNYRVRHVLDRPFRFVELAQDVNASMPAYVVGRVQDLLNDRKQALNGSEVLLLGVSYKSGISDTRESPANEVARILLDKGANVSYFDPHVEVWLLGNGQQIPRVVDLSFANQFSAIILLQAIPGVELDMLAEARGVFFDTRGASSLEGAVRL